MILNKTTKMHESDNTDDNQKHVESTLGSMLL